MKNDKNDLEQELFHYALRLLAIRGRSKKELLELLITKARKFHLSYEQIVSVIDRLESLRYIDDRKFAETYVSFSVCVKKRGIERVIRELRERGLSDDDDDGIDHTRKYFQDCYAEDEIAFARHALGKRGNQYRLLPIDKCRKKVYGFLLRRGFSSHVISSLVDEWCKTPYNKRDKSS